MKEEIYNNFHKRVEELTGDPWCPYPSEGFMNAIMKCQNHTAEKLIKIRRTYSFPQFLSGDPQQKDIDIILPPLQDNNLGN